MSAPIVELLKKSTLAAIKEQIDYLSNAKEQPETFDQERFSALHDGAKTVLSIIESDPICKQGTDTYLNTLDRDQLAHAITSAQKLVKQRASLGQIMLHGVFPGRKANKWFADIDEAKNFFLIAAEIELTQRYPEISMSSDLFPIEEAGEYIEGFDWEVYVAAHPERLIK
jgi:hypothetical protein